MAVSSAKVASVVAGENRVMSPCVMQDSESRMTVLARKCSIYLTGGSLSTTS
jgi:hypothetical protein